MLQRQELAGGLAPAAHPTGHTMPFLNKPAHHRAFPHTGLVMHLHTAAHAACSAPNTARRTLECRPMRTRKLDCDVAAANDDNALGHLQTVCKAKGSSIDRRFQCNAGA